MQNFRSDESKEAWGKEWVRLWKERRELGWKIKREQALDNHQHDPLWPEDQYQNQHLTEGQSR